MKTDVTALWNVPFCGVKKEKQKQKQRNRQSCCPCLYDWLVCRPPARWQENLLWRWDWIPKTKTQLSILGLTPQDLSLPYIPSRTLPSSGRVFWSRRKASEKYGSCVKEAWVSFPSNLCGTPGVGALLGESDHLGQRLFCSTPINSELSQVC